MYVNANLRKSDFTQIELTIRGIKLMNRPKNKRKIQGHLRAKLCRSKMTFNVKRPMKNNKCNAGNILNFKEFCPTEESKENLILWQGSANMKKN
jgi:hypothetical protein